jgi:diguanylate cyclase (GGDEF)-like protein
MSKISIWISIYKSLSRALFGKVRFAEREEYQEFRYKLLMVLMFSGAVVTAFFILGTLGEVNPIGPDHQRSMFIFTGLTSLLTWVLRNHPERFVPVAWLYEVVCLFENTSALTYVSSDELRVLWFFTNVPGVFILLGKRAGWIITIATILGLILGNPYLERPYSPNALATGLFCLLYLGIFFHTYVDRTFSYFTRMRDYNDRLQDMASHDPLTQVLNARAYYQACEQLILQLKRSKLTYSVLFVDLDHFKLINDSHGHAAGDEVLKRVANVLQCQLRQTDLLGRIGGEEFSIFLPDTPLNGAMKLAESIRLAIEQCRPAIGQQNLTVTASVGVAANTLQLSSMQAIQQHADEAMYEAKKAGRNRVTTLQSSTGLN